MNDARPSQPPSRPVRRRIARLVPGFDPVPARRHRECDRRQAALPVHEIILGPSRSRDGYGWHVEARIAATPAKPLEEGFVLRHSSGVHVAVAAGPRPLAARSQAKSRIGRSVSRYTDPAA